MFLVITKKECVDDLIIPYNNKEVIILNKICDLKNLKKVIDVLVLDDCIIDENAKVLINDNIIYLDEIFIMKKVKLLVITSRVQGMSRRMFLKINDICSYYKLDLMVIS